MRSNPGDTAIALHSRAGPGRFRQFWVVAHRWAGLTIALFVAVAALTGAMLPWSQQLTWLSAPGLYDITPPTPGARPLPGERLAQIVQQKTGTYAYTPLAFDRDHRVQMYLTGRPGGGPLRHDSVIVDPYTGAILAAYRYGRLADGPQNIVPFLYALHTSLAVGAWGTWVMGIAALIWTLDCFVGFYLTLPLPRVPSAPRARKWLTRWRPAWQIRWGKGGYRRHFDLHRAGGLWLWPLLLVFAWSSVGFNLPQVHDPVMRLLGERAPADLPVLPTPLATPALGPVDAVRAGRAAVADLGRRNGFTLQREVSLGYFAENGAYRYRLRSSLDRNTEDGDTVAWIDGNTGAILRFDPPFPAGTAGTIDGWLSLLHYAAAFGLPYRMFVSLFGLCVATLSVTGILIWIKKRKARHVSRHRAS